MKVVVSENQINLLTHFHGEKHDKEALYPIVLLNVTQI